MVRVYLKSGPSLPGPSLPGPSLLVLANTRAKVYSPDGVSEEIDIVEGVLQGDTLSSYLFIIVPDYALRKAINGR